MQILTFARASVPYMVGLIFITGAFYKALDPTEAATALTKVGLNLALAHTIIVIASLCELYVGARLFQPRHHLRFSKIAAFLLVGFTVFLVVLRTAGVQSCGCTGLERLAGKAVNPILFGITRNIVLIVLVEYFIWDFRENRSHNEYQT